MVIRYGKLNLKYHPVHCLNHFQILCLSWAFCALLDPVGLIVSILLWKLLPTIEYKGNIRRL
ncbi:hypothetical protein K450DRAFT_236677 [Umbelopsis ramanniana AG]|uniref:Uncharacterized protein n=1 Tax=Umbelopsis ramanniana AG TaxID=1314678 RepID=A0AAD5ECX5_UMBRA|nr:uncharacterized protein K450DRAFT_236677 [Umbelopsis ramanniana AG]KAI8580661.1 hypothetical protein K450DRAFT_236677 [Umbelopsis ramanniana AG]